MDIVDGISLKGNHTCPRALHGNDADSRSVLLFTFASLLVGALLRSMLKDTSVPTRVVLFVIGLALGIMSILVNEIRDFSLISAVDPHLMMHIFLPVFVFDAAYATESHTLLKAFTQIFVLAVPCFVCNAFLIGVLIMYIFPFNWSWPVSLAFGAVISSTDPLAVISILKDLGTDKKLVILLEGESLLNDVAALLFFTMFLSLAHGDYENNTNLGKTLTIAVLRAVLGGILLGYVMGKLCSAWLARTFNDVVVEPMITIAFPYITYYIADVVFQVSGILAVTVLGTILSSEKTSVTPDVQTFLPCLWNLLAFASNTLVFIIAGMVVAEIFLHEISSKNWLDGNDWFFIIALYFGVVVIRGLTLLLFTPILLKIGHGLSWQKSVVMWWGSPRGALCIVLALLVARDNKLDHHTIGSKFLVFTAAVVVLTRLINGSSMKFLLRIVGLTKISLAKKMAMTAAIKALEETRRSTAAHLKSDRFLADAYWDLVMKMTEIKNPYENWDVKVKRSQTEAINHVVCTECNNIVKAELNVNQLREYEEDARIRYLKAQKTCYWRQFEKGLLSQSAVRKLMELTDAAADIPGKFVTVQDLQSFWQLRWIYKLFPLMSLWLKKVCTIFFRDPIPNDLSSKLVFKIASSQKLRWTVVSFVASQIILGIVELLLLQNGFHVHLLFLTISINYTLFFTVELVIKVFGLGLKLYCFKLWNSVAVLTWIASFPEMYALYEVERFLQSGDNKEALQYEKMASYIRITRGIRILETVVETLLPAMVKVIDRRIENQLNFGYDIGRGFVVGEEECRKLIDHIIEHRVMREKFKSYCDSNRLAVIKELALLQRGNPGVAVAVKTRQATRTVLNKIVDTVIELKEDGLVYDSEANRLLIAIEKMIKLLHSAPPSIAAMPADHMLSFVPWLQGVDASIAKFMRQRAQLINFDHGDIILRAGEALKGIYIITSGLVKVTGKRGLSPQLTTEIGTLTSQPDPNEETFTDYLSAGAVIGAMGLNTNTENQSHVTAETAVQFFFLHMVDLELAFDMYPEIRLKLWKNIALNLIFGILADHKELKMMPKEAAKLYLDRGYIPHLSEQTVYNLDDNIAYAFLVHGHVRELNRADVEVMGPAYIPSKVRVLEFNDPNEIILFLIPEEENPLAAVDSIHEGMRIKLKAFASSMSRKFMQQDQEQSALKKKPTTYDSKNVLAVKSLLRRKSSVLPSKDFEEMQLRQKGVEKPRDLLREKSLGKITRHFLPKNSKQKIKKWETPDDKEIHRASSEPIRKRSGYDLTRSASLNNSNRKQETYPNENIWSVKPKPEMMNILRETAKPISLKTKPITRSMVVGKVQLPGQERLSTDNSMPQSKILDKDRKFHNISSKNLQSKEHMTKIDIDNLEQLSTLAHNPEKTEGVRKKGMNEKQPANKEEKIKSISDSEKEKVMSPDHMMTLCKSEGETNTIRDSIKEPLRRVTLPVIITTPPSNQSTFDNDPGK